jgi:hypothetical protein
MKILNYKPYKSEKNGPLMGFLDISIETKEFGWLNVYGVKAFDTGAKRWFNLPSKKSEKKDEKTGKDIYFPDCKLDDFDCSNEFNLKLLILFDAWLSQPKQAEIIKDIPF